MTKHVCPNPPEAFVLACRAHATLVFLEEPCLWGLLDARELTRRPVTHHRGGSLTVTGGVLHWQDWQINSALAEAAEVSLFKLVDHIM